MCVKTFLLADSGDTFRPFNVEGHSYDPVGEVVGLDKFGMRANLNRFVNCLSLCNESNLLIDAETNNIVPSGLPTEAALKVLVEKIG